MPLLATPPELASALFSMPGGSEWIVILLIALLLFGRRLPEIMRGLGSSVREFKKGMDTEPERSAPIQPPVEGAVSRPTTLPPPEQQGHGQATPQSQPENQNRH